MTTRGRYLLALLVALSLIGACVLWRTGIVKLHSEDITLPPVTAYHE